MYPLECSHVLIIMIIMHLTGYWVLGSVVCADWYPAGCLEIKGAEGCSIGANLQLKLHCIIILQLVTTKTSTTLDL